MSRVDVLLPLAEVARRLGRSRSSVYRDLRTGKYRAVKDGFRTLVPEAELAEHVESLPVAEFRPVPNART